MARLLFKQWYACSGESFLVDHVFSQSEPSTLPVTYMYKRALHRTHPFELHSITICSSIGTRNFRDFLASIPFSSFFFLLCLCSTYLMGLPRVLVLGDSFIRRLHQFVLPNILALIFILRIVLLSNGTVLGAT